MESMSRNKNSSVEQNIVLCGKQIAEKPVPLPLSAKNSTHTIIQQNLFIVHCKAILCSPNNRKSLHYFKSLLLILMFRCASYKTPKRSVWALARDIYISCSKSNRIIWSRRVTTGNVRKLRLHLFDHVSLF